MRKNKFLRFLIPLILVVTMLFGNALNVLAEPDSSGDYAQDGGSNNYTGSNKRTNNGLKMAAGKALTEDDLSEGFTQDQLRFLGVYISNFYVPFGTELGVASKDSKISKQNKDEMVKALSKGLNFSDGLASSLVDTLVGLTRNCKELTFCIKQKSGYVEVPNTSPNYYNFVRCMFGRADAVFEWYKGKEGSVKKNAILDGTYKKGYLCYSGEGGKYIPVGDFYWLKQNGYTPFQIAFLKCLESVDSELGYGSNFFDLTASEASKESLEKLVKSTNNKQALDCSILGMKMNVDCFGNILILGGNHQFVCIPGCMNPFTWVGLDEDGKDALKAGDVYNAVNIPSMVMAQSGRLCSDSIKNGTVTLNDKKTKVKLSSTSFDTLYSKLSSSTKIPEPAKTYSGYYKLNVSRGSKDTKLDQSDGSWGTDPEFALAKAAVLGFKSVNSGDHSFLTQYTSPGTGGDAVYHSLYDISTGFADANYYLCAGPTDTMSISSFSMLDGIILIDNLGAFHFDNSDQPLDYNALQPSHFFGDDGKSLIVTNENFSVENTGFGSIFSNIKEGNMQVDSIDISDAAVVSLYVTYVYASLYESGKESETCGKIGFRMAIDTLPNIPAKAISISAAALGGDGTDADSESDERLESIRDWLYYLLHPTKGLVYFRELITNKFNSFLLGLHNDMVGTNGVGITTGTTKYRSTTGYVTTPDLSEIQWTSALLNFYNNIIPFLIIAMVVTMLFAYISGVLSLQRSIFGALLFTLFLFLPVNLINGVVETSNKVSTRLYGEKFTYWALVQQETYESKIEEAANGTSYDNYLRTLFDTNSTVYSNQGDESIVLKWQAPKKMSSLMLSAQDKEATSNLQGQGMDMLDKLFNKAYSGESFTGNPDSLYMFRSYLDLSNFSRYIYRGIKEGKMASTKTIPNNISSNFGKDLKNQINQMGIAYEKDRNLGYTNVNANGSKSVENTLRITVPMSSAFMNDAFAQKGTIKKLGIDDFVGLNQNLFNFSIPLFNVGVSDVNSLLNDYLLSNLDSDTDGEKDAVTKEVSNKTVADFSGLAAYGIYSENVFYYFSWALYDMGLKTEVEDNGFKDLLLGGENADFFYNNKGNGELKDFMDMKSLFTYIIPYLKLGNDIVREWDDTYGIFFYSDVPFDEGHWDDEGIKDDPVKKQKYWHNVNVARLFQIYTPWVDIMYDCSYSKPEKISALGSKFTVENPLDPASYPEGRPMIFSESEMKDYGLSKGDLTKAEKLIIKCNQGMQERLYELLNYYTFSDITLNSAAAINCAFEFNTTFSESGLFTENHNIYPQTFELNNFSYDAFLRFILSNNTGESMLKVLDDVEDVNRDGSESLLGANDFYGYIIQNSSTTTAVVMIALDVLSVYVLPAFKIFFLIAVFVLSILIIIVTAFRVDRTNKFVKRVVRGVVMPMLYFFLVTTGFALVISLFMGKGNDAVTNSNDLSIIMGDPVVVMIAMIAIDIVVLILYWKILRGVISDIKFNAKLAVNFVQETYGSVGSKIAGMFGGALGAVSGGSRGSNGTKESSNGTGSTSSRAEHRSNKATKEDSEDRSTRTNNDGRRETIKESSSGTEKTSTSKSNINDVMESGKDKIKTNNSSNQSPRQQESRERLRNTDNKVNDPGGNKK